MGNEENEKLRIVDLRRSDNIIKSSSNLQSVDYVVDRLSLRYSMSFIGGWLCLFQNKSSAQNLTLVAE